MAMTAWHIAFATYGARLHGDDRPTVDREHNEFGTPFLPPDPERNGGERGKMVFDPVLFTKEQQRFIENVVLDICERGGWRFVTCAAGPDHVHTLLRADSAIHGKRVRTWMKRWLTEALDKYWSVPKRSDGMSWFCDGGSTKAVRDDKYFTKVGEYIYGQRANARGQRGEVAGDDWADSDSTGRIRPGSLRESL